MKKKKTIVYAFIDSQNVNLAIEDQGWKLDFKRFRVYLSEKYKVQKAFLFLGYIRKYESMYKELRSYGYVIIFKPTLDTKRGKIKGNIDAELVLHTMIEFSKYSKAIIASGDGDFYCLVEYLLKKNKFARLIVPNQKKYSKLFLVFKKHIDFMNNLRQKIGIKKGSVVLRTKP